MGAKETLPRGDMFLNGQIAYETVTPSNTKLFRQYKLRFKIVGPNGDARYVLAHYRDGSNTLYPGYITTTDGDTDNTVQHYWDDPILTSNNTTYATCSPFAWICYPDTRCTQVEIEYQYDDAQSQRITVYRTIPLEPHPLLECAYAFFGFGTPLYEAGNAATGFNSEESRTMLSNNKIFLSRFENPFLFPAEGIITFNDNVIGAALTSVALSEGQFGEFPLYVFTEGGIKVLATNDEGTFSGKITPPNMARHVALPGTIIGLDQSIVFTTDKGVMLLTGSNVQCISTLMNGRHWALDDGLPNSDKLSTMLSRPVAEGGWVGYGYISAALSDNKTFMEYIKQAKVAYDYNGRRLMFCKDGAGYFYVYMLDTSTWHKMISEETTRTILNSFPECLMASGGSNGGLVYDYSTVLDKQSILSDDSNVRYSLIVTRPLDLGEPDVRKAIRDLRVRGRYNHIHADTTANPPKPADVKYILLGSMNGTNWSILRTLRGGSFKWFRIVLLCSLSPTERVTWIDVDYEARFANRLR